MTNWKETTKSIFVVTSRIILLLGVVVLIYALMLYISNNISSEVSKTILDYLRAIIWPSVVLFVVITFKENIARLIERLEEGDNPFVGKWRASHASSISQQQEQTPSDIEERGADADFEKIVEEKEFEISALKDNQQELVNKLTFAEIELDFERIYNLIFASQIELLAKLGVNSPVDFPYLMNHFLGVQRANREVLKDWDIHQYLNYLFRTQLIERNDSNISITSKGRAFLFYLSRMNYRKYDL